MKGKLYFDGKTTPKGSSIGIVLILENETKGAGKFLGEGYTSNQTEYIALIKGLEYALKKGVKELEVFGDSQLVIYQMTGKYKVNNPKLYQLWKKAKELAKKFENISFHWIERKFNSEADKVAEIILKKYTS